MDDLPEFTVVRGRWPKTGGVEIVVKVDGIWAPPGDECWWYSSDEAMRNGPHHLVDIEVVASPVVS